MECHNRAGDSALALGSPAPDLALTDARGRPHRFTEFRGSPVVLVVHGPSWDPMRAELVAAYNRVVGGSGARRASLVSIGPNAPWHELAFDGDEPLSLPILSGDGADAGLDTPSVVVIDADGIVRWRHSAETPFPRPAELEAALSALADRGKMQEEQGWSRREFVACGIAAGVALLIGPSVRRAVAMGSEIATDDSVSATIPVALRVNGRDVRLTLEPRVTLLDALREYAGITGPKKGCDHGQCGACTVHIDGRRTLSCLTFAVMQQGKAITTIEGLARVFRRTLHPMQQAFLAHDGFQCGYCTPGQIMSAAAMLHEPWGPGDDDVREAMSGNICRCGAYPGIVAAIQEVRRGVRPQGGAAIVIPFDYTAATGRGRRGPRRQRTERRTTSPVAPR